jgi:hypothetical protein
MLRRAETILPLKGQAIQMGRTFGAQDSIERQRLRLQSPQFIRSPGEAGFS